MIIDKKIITIIAVALVIVIGIIVIKNGAVNDVDPNAHLLGTWELQGEEQGIIIEILPDGEVLVIEKEIDRISRGVWAVSGDILSFHEEGRGEMMRFTIREDKLLPMARGEIVSGVFFIRK